jgi:hypothetical protein
MADIQAKGSHMALNGSSKYDLYEVVWRRNLLTIYLPK